MLSNVKLQTICNWKDEVIKPSHSSLFSPGKAEGWNSLIHCGILFTKFYNLANYIRLTKDNLSLTPAGKI